MITLIDFFFLDKFWFLEPDELFFKSYSVLLLTFK